MLDKLMVEVEKERYFKTEYYYENVWEEGLVDNQGQRFSDYVRTRKKREVEVRSKKDAIRIETYTETMTARHYLRFLNKKSQGKHLDKGKEIINKNLRINKKRELDIKESKKYTEEYKNELLEEVKKDNKETEDYLEKLERYYKTDKRTRAKINKGIREIQGDLQEYINEKYKLSKRYIEYKENRFKEENPDLIFTFESDRLMVVDNEEVVRRRTIRREVDDEFKHYIRNSK